MPLYDQLVIGVDVQAWDADLDAISALSSNGLVARTGSGVAAARTIGGESGVVNVANGDGVSGNPAISIATNGLPFTKISQVVTASVLGRNTAGTGNIEVLSALPSAVQDNITRLGTIGTGVWQGTKIAESYGGTNQSTYSAGDLLQATASNTLGTLSAVATGNALISGGIGTASSWGKIGLTTHVSGLLAGANGGTNNGFTEFTGPSTSLKTFTLPNASATILTTAAAVSTTQGGTGQDWHASSGIPLLTSGTFSLLTSTGSGDVVRATSPALVSPALGTPTSGVATNLTGTAAGLTAGTVTTNANLTGPITSSGNATAIASQTGTGTKFVMDTAPALVTPSLGVATATSITASGQILAKGATNIGTDFGLIVKKPMVVYGTGGGIVAVSAGASGNDYGSIGFNVDYQASAGNYKYLASEFASEVRFDSGGMVLRGAASGTAGGALSFTTLATFAQSGAVSLPGIGTTASAANGFFDAAASNNVLRSTSSLNYKRVLGPLPLDEARNIVLKSESIRYQSKSPHDSWLTEYVGFPAEQVAKIDDRFVTRRGDSSPDWVQYPAYVVPLCVVAADHDSRLARIERALNLN